MINYVHLPSSESFFYIYDPTDSCLSPVRGCILPHMKADRKEMAVTITNDPTSYKLCTVCGAIVDKSADTCPDCYAYRFDENPQAVADAALDLAIKPQTAVSHLDLIPEN